MSVTVINFLIYVLLCSSCAAGNSSAAANNSEASCNIEKPTLENLDKTREKYAAQAESKLGSVTGTYEMKADKYHYQLHVFDLGDGDLQVEFMAKADAKDEPEGNPPEIVTVRRKGVRATLKLKDYPKCPITFDFTRAALTLVQNGSDADCIWGSEYAPGVYKKITTDSPNFGEWTRTDKE